MNEHESELSELRNNLANKIKEINEYNRSIRIKNSIANLITTLAISIFGSEEEKQKLDKKLEEDKQRNFKIKENNEKGYLPYFDSSLEPISQEFGCPYCGEYCYPVNYIPGGSHCEADCEFSGQTMIYCPKKKCKFELFCQSTMVPLGMILDDNSRYGYNANESFTIAYKNKVYTFTVKSEYLTAGMLAYFIYEFVNYNLTRKEITEYIWLESVIILK